MIIGKQNESDAPMGKESEAKPEYAIEFSNVSKFFRIQHERKTTLQDFFINLFRGPGTAEEFWALKNVSFELEKGKTLGLIGHNGAGKSTILKLVTRILEPTSGRIRVNGRVSAMLELGTGFHPELSGRDNVFLNGAIYGFNHKQMLERYEQIVEFSELEHFIDIPVKHYSSGMYMRLAFATAITVDPDIIIIDEVLAVGDAAFSRKCYRALEDLKRQGKSLLFVSHAAGEVARFCDEVIYLSKGEVQARGTPPEVLDEYMMSTMGVSFFQMPVQATPDQEAETTSAFLPESQPVLTVQRKPLHAGVSTLSRFWRFGAAQPDKEKYLALFNPTETVRKVHLHTGMESLEYSLPSLKPALVKLEDATKQGFTLEAEAEIAVQQWPEALAGSEPKNSSERWFFPVWDLRPEAQAQLSVFNPGKHGCGVAVSFFRPGQNGMRRTYLAQPGAALVLDLAAELNPDKAWADGGGGDGGSQPGVPAYAAIWVESTTPVLVEKFGLEQTATVPDLTSVELKIRQRQTS